MKRKQKVYCFVTNDRMEFMISAPLPLKEFCEKYNLKDTYVLYAATRGQYHKHKGRYKIVGFYEEG